MNQKSVRQFQTTMLESGPGLSPRAPIWSMKVTDINVSSNPKLYKCVYSDYAGTHVGTVKYTVFSEHPHVVGDLIFVFMPGGGTGQQVGSRDVTLAILPDVPAGTIFIVNLAETGGSAGSGAAPPSWVYTVTNLHGVTLGTAMSPARGRDYNGNRTAASKGYGHYDLSGNFVLDEAWESPGTIQCSTTP